MSPHKPITQLQQLSTHDQPCFTEPPTIIPLTLQIILKQIPAII